MFPTAGYFRNLPCPFYKHGLCHRPYCHFRHAKPDKKAKRDIDWTYGEIVDSGTADSTTNDDVIKYTPSEIKKSSNEPEKKDSFSLFKPYEENEDAELIKGKERKPKRDAITTDDAASDPIPTPVVKEITDLLKITNETDQSAEIAHLVKNRKKNSKKDKQETKEKDEETRDDKSDSEAKQDEVGGNIFDILKPAKPPKLKDVEFFALDLPATKPPTKRRKTHLKSKRIDKESLSESSSESVDNSEETMRRIFEEYDPIADAAVEASLDSEEKQLKTTIHGEPDYIPVSCVETVGAGSVRKRIAHNTNAEVVRQRINKKGFRCGSSRPTFMSPYSRLQEKEKSKETKTTIEMPTGSSFTTDSGVPGKKRISHANVDRTLSIPNGVTAPVKPRIPMQFGSKVPQVIRQRYLERMIDEYITKASSLQEVYDKALEEEEVVYNRCTSKQIYMNLCVNSIKRIRSLPPVSQKKAGNPIDSARPTGHSFNDLQMAGASAAPRKVIRPSTIALAASEKKHSSLVTDKSSLLIKKRKSSINGVPELSENLFYENLSKYVASEGDLWDNNYPRESKEKPGLATYKENKPAIHPTKRTCARCGKTFFLDLEGEYKSREECHYHWGRLRRMRGRGEILSQFSCCKGDAASVGCSVGKLHVSEYASSNDGYVVTKINPTKNTRKVFSLDCEMCYTVNGLELTRVTVVDFKMTQVYDSFVRPNWPIIDYNTRFSGISEKSLRNVKTTLQDIQQKLLEMFGRDTILIGHSLESDLRAMKIIHQKIVDTALVFPHRLGLPYKRALKTLMGEFLQKIIQDSDRGHDSFEDSASCMELMKWKVTEELKKQSRTVGAHSR